MRNGARLARRRRRLVIGCWFRRLRSLLISRRRAAIRLGRIDNLQDVTGMTGLDQQGEVVGAWIAARFGLEDVGRHGMPLIVTGYFSDAGILHLKTTFDKFEQAGLHAQERLGIVVEVGVTIRPCAYRQCEKCHGQR